MVHKAPGFAVRNLFFSDRVEYWLNLVELTLPKGIAAHRRQKQPELVSPIAA